MEQERLARLPPVVEKKASGSKFAAFLDETEEEERKEREEEQMRLKIEEDAAALVAKRESEFPSLGMKSTSKTSAPAANNWSVMAQNASALPIPKAKVIAKAVEVLKPKTNYVGWAEDSDDEYQEEMYESAVANDDEPSSPRPFEFPPLSSTPCYARATADDNDW